MITKHDAMLILDPLHSLTDGSEVLSDIKPMERRQNILSEYRHTTGIFNQILII